MKVFMDENGDIFIFNKKRNRCFTYVLTDTHGIKQFGSFTGEEMRALLFIYPITVKHAYLVEPFFKELWEVAKCYS